MTHPPSRIVIAVALFDSVTFQFFPVLPWREPEAEPRGPFFLPRKVADVLCIFFFFFQILVTLMEEEERNIKGFATWLTLPFLWGRHQTSPLLSKKLLALPPRCSFYKDHSGVAPQSVYVQVQVTLSPLYPNNWMTWCFEEGSLITRYLGWGQDRWVHWGVRSAAWLDGDPRGNAGPMKSRVRCRHFRQSRYK